MSNFLLSKKAITKKIVETNQDLNLKWALSHWWKNPRESGGLRLTELGHKHFKESFDSWEFTWDLLDSKLSTLYISLLLDRKLHCPYFIEYGLKNIIKITIYDSRIASIIILNGSLEKFIQTQENRKNM